MEKALADWADQSDAVYLFANDSVLNFYPRFGFEKAAEYQYCKAIGKKDVAVRRLNMSDADDRSLLLRTYRCSNPFSALPMRENEGVLMFNCTQFMHENIYYISRYEAVAIAGYKNELLYCYDVFCPDSCTLDDILCTMAGSDTEKAVLGFAPKQTCGFQITEHKEDNTTLFILKGKENLFGNNKLMIPVLTHA
jgi:hypothetical protein